MSSIFADGALHPGRDANDSSWMIVRTAVDLIDPHYRQAHHDPGRNVFELDSRPLAAAAGPLEVTAADGTVYRSDPDRDRVVVVCGGSSTPLPHFGGHGTATGRLRRPLGLALDDRGFLYVADADNHRVQVVRPADGSVVIVLGCANAWGEPIAGTTGGAMTEPVDVAVGRHGIYVADSGGHAVHFFDRGFRWVRSLTPAAQPIAIDITATGEIIVVDAGASRLLRFTSDGEQLADLGFGELPVGLTRLANTARYARRGEIVLGPFDGRAEDLAWHRVIVDADLPAGTSIEVQTFAASTPGVTLPIVWAPAQPVPIPLAGEREYQRPVLSDHGRWQRERHGRYRRVALPIADYRGDGPNLVAALTLSGIGLARVRTGDVVELRAATTVERVTIDAIVARDARFALRGTRKLYPSGTRIELRERGGTEPYPGPWTLYTLGPGETIDLTGLHDDGRIEQAKVPHAAQMMWRRGDIVALIDGADVATLIVDDIADGAVAVPLLAPPGDFRTATAHIVETTGRLLLADVDGFDAQTPPDEPITIDGITAGAPWTDHATARWVEPDLGVLWVTAPSGFHWADWESFTTVTAQATDRGRYLWLRLRLNGAVARPGDLDAVATPTIRSIRLLRPRLSFLRYLPGTFGRRDADDPSGALFLERILALLEASLTRIEARYEDVARELDPRAADPEWLRFIASWFDLILDPDLPLDRQRLLVAELHSLYATRGTPAGIRRYIEIVTGHEPSIVEGFQVRPSSGLVIGCSGVLGCSELGGEQGTLDRYAHRFTLYVFTDDPCRREAVDAAMRRLLPTIVPAHAVVDLHVVVPDARVGAQAQVGVDLVLGDGRQLPHVLGEGAASTERPYPVLGLDAVLVPSPPSTPVGARLDDDLLLG